MRDNYLDEPQCRFRHYADRSLGARRKGFKDASRRRSICDPVASEYPVEMECCKRGGGGLGFDGRMLGQGENYKALDGHSSICVLRSGKREEGL